MIINAVIGAVLGAAAGLVIGKYMSQVGLNCPLLCNPKISTIYFAVMGSLIAIGK